MGWHRHGRLAGARWPQGLLHVAEAAVSIDLGAVFAQGLGRGNGDAISGAQIVAGGGVSQGVGLSVAGAQTFDIDHIDGVAVSHHRAGIPVGRDEALHHAVSVLGVRQFEHRNGIVAGGGDEQAGSILAQGQAARGTAKRQG